MIVYKRVYSFHFDHHFTHHTAPLIVDLNGTPLHVITSKLQTSCRWIHPNSQDEALVYVEDKQTTAEIIASNRRRWSGRIFHPYSALSQPNDHCIQNNGIQTDGLNFGHIQQVEGKIMSWIPDIVLSDMASDTILQGTSFVPDEPDTTDFNGQAAYHRNTFLIYKQWFRCCRYFMIQYTHKSAQSVWFGAIGMDRNWDWWGCRSGSEGHWLITGRKNSALINIAIKEAIENGVMIVAASGNRTGGYRVTCQHWGHCCRCNWTWWHEKPVYNMGKELSISAQVAISRKKWWYHTEHHLGGWRGLYRTPASMAALSLPHSLLMSAGVGNPLLFKLFLKQRWFGKGWDTQYGHGRSFWCRHDWPKHETNLSIHYCRIANRRTCLYIGDPLCPACYRNVRFFGWWILFSAMASDDRIDVMDTTVESFQWTKLAEHTPAFGIVTLSALTFLSAIFKV